LKASLQNYRYIKNGKAELCDASQLWGADTVKTEAVLLMEAGPRARIACIGPTGEMLSLISGICNDVPPSQFP
jgi:aldehyde:ferredoxin oxidoreductase